MEEKKDSSAAPAPGEPVSHLASQDAGRPWVDREPMVFRVLGSDGHVIAPEVVVPWEELWILKRTLFVSVSFEEIVWH